MPLPIHVPTATGLAALVELGRVEWRKLDHAYGRSRPDGNLNHDAEASLAALATDYPAAIEALYSNIYHQKTVYEATAYAVPFLAAAACEPSWRPAQRRQMIALIGAIALSSTLTTEDGTSAGAHGEGIGDLIRDGLRASLPRLQQTEFTPIVTALAALLAADPITRGHFETLREELVALEDRKADDEPALAPAETQRYRHAKLGDATLVRRQENGLRLRFDDGTERVIQERFLTKL